MLDAELLDRALTHRSFAYENGGLPTNERLEFLGDSVLGVVVTETLFRTHPDLSEGQLAKLRAAVVNARALAEVARDARARQAHQARPRRGGHRRPRQVLDPVRRGRGADRRRLPRARLRGRRRGRAPAVRPADGDAARLGAGLDWKTSLQELSAEPRSACRSTSSRTSGPDHEKTFTAQVRVGDGRVRRTASAGRKKEAEQQAAETAYRAIAETHGDLTA